jgi:hypothetical protein
VASADVVVGMTSLLSQSVEQTLSRHAEHYLRNARGVAGLRGELADLALSGRGLIAGKGAVANRAGTNALLMYRRTTDEPPTSHNGNRKRVYSLVDKLEDILGTEACDYRSKEA